MCLYGVVMTILGFVFNFFCFITAGYMPQTNSAHLMRYLAVWDSICAMRAGILHLGLRYFDVFLASFNDISCRVFWFYVYVSGITGNYLVMAMAMDRLVAITFPFFHKDHSSKKVAIIIGSSCVAFGHFISLPVFLLLWS